MDERQAVICTHQGCTSYVGFVLCSHWTMKRGRLIIHIKHKRQAPAPEGLKQALLCQWQQRNVNHSGKLFSSCLLSYIDCFIFLLLCSSIFVQKHKLWIDFFFFWILLQKCGENLDLEMYTNKWCGQNIEKNRLNAVISLCWFMLAGSLPLLVFVYIPHFADTWVLLLLNLCLYSV